jgi:outer membrane lipoprotein SlyB
MKMEAVQQINRSAWWAVPRAVWIGAAAFGIAAMSAGAAMWLQPKTSEPSPAPVAAVKPAKAVPAAKQHAAAPVAATTCANCGVVESVVAVTRKGQGTGLGAVGGGVVGAALGNQVGKGNGRTAMTVLGAVGGGLAGNEIEKRARSETVFDVRVRLDDGTLRTVEQRQAPRVGERVELHGNVLKSVTGPA